MLSQRKLRPPTLRRLSPEARHAHARRLPGEPLSPRLHPSLHGLQHVARIPLRDPDRSREAALLDHPPKRAPRHPDHFEHLSRSDEPHCPPPLSHQPPGICWCKREASALRGSYRRKSRRINRGLSIELLMSERGVPVIFRPENPRRETAAHGASLVYVPRNRPFHKTRNRVASGTAGLRGAVQQLGLRLPSTWTVAQATRTQEATIIIRAPDSSDPRPGRGRPDPRARRPLTPASCRRCGQAWPRDPRLEVACPCCRASAGA